MVAWGIHYSEKPFVSDVLLMCYDKGDDCFCAEAQQNPNGKIHSDTFFVAVVIKYLGVKFCFLFTFCLSLTSPIFSDKSSHGITEILYYFIIPLIQ